MTTTGNISMKFTQEEKNILAQAAQILESKAFKEAQLNSVLDSKNYCKYKLAHHERGLWCCFP